MTPSQDSLVAAQAALATADWAAAKGHFESALREQESPEAHDGLGIALWWLNDVAAAHQQRMLAYVGYRNRGELPRAALIATWLAREQVFLHANGSAMNGWFARAARLLGQAGPCAEQGWFTILRASMLAAPEELRHAALQAMDVARAFGDPELEAMALAFQGLASVTLGEVENGMLCLDEAMAAATGGELRDFMVASEVFCVMLSACELAGDLVRTENWCRIASDFAQRHACPFLSAYCRTTYGSLLLATGRWQDAETELLAAIRSFESGHRGLRVHAVLKLADLRVSQGRLEEAQVLLAGYEDHGAAVVPLARLHLARGEVQLAYALLRQALGSAPSGTLGRAPLLMALVDVLLAQGDLNAAADIAEELVLCAQQAGGDLLLAQAELTRGLVKRWAGEPDASSCLEGVLNRLRRYEQSLVAGRAKLELARLLEESDWAGAVTWGRAALASFDRIGAARDAEEARKLLRELGVAGRVGGRRHESLTPREAEVLALIARGRTNREIAERLIISVKTVEHHVSQVLGKLGLQSRTEAAAYAIKHNLNEIPE